MSDRTAIPDPRFEERRPVGELLGEIWQKTEVLLRHEVELGLVELDRRTDTARRDLGQAALGGAVAMAGFLVLLAAVVLFVAQYLAAWLSALIVGGVVSACGYGMLKLGARDARRQAAAPLGNDERTRGPMRRAEGDV